MGADENTEKAALAIDLPKCFQCTKLLSGDGFQFVFDGKGKEINPQSMLLECSGVSIDKDTTAYQALCTDCVNNLIEIYETSQNEKIAATKTIGEVERYHSPESDETLSKSEDTTENVDRKEEAFEEYYLEDLDDDGDITTYKMRLFAEIDFRDVRAKETFHCRICGNSFDGFDSIIIHVFESHSLNSFFYPCPISAECPLVRSSTELSCHLLDKHIDLNGLVLPTKCPECDQRFRNFYDHNKHVCTDGTNTKLSRTLQKCEQCCEEFCSNKRYRFHTQFHLRKRRPKACLICNKKFRLNDALFEHVTYEHGCNEFVCRKCDIQFTSASTFERHLPVHQSEKNKYSCDVCSTTFMHRRGFEEHKQVEHSEHKANICEICTKQFKTKRLFKEHQKRHDEEAVECLYVCTACGAVDAKKSGIMIHIDEHHDSDMKLSPIKEELKLIFICEHCDLLFNSIPNLKSHRNLHDKKDYKCGTCKKSFTDFSRLICHKRVHTDESESIAVARNFVCEFENCAYTCLLRSTLRKHKITVHTNTATDLTLRKKQTHMTRIEGGIKCESCDKVCNTRMAMHIHVTRVHSNSNDSMISCEACHKTFGNRKRLRAHISTVHARVDRAFCHFCGKGFLSNYKREQHEKSVHEKTTRYECSFCEYKTFYQQNLRFHEMQHANNLPNVCKYCQKRFARSSDLGVHERIHEKHKQFACGHDTCTASFPSRGLLNKHKKNKHREEVPQHDEFSAPDANTQPDSPTIFVDDEDERAVENFILGV